MAGRVRRGEIWSVAGAGNYPRPAVILQDDRIYTTDSITVCPLTSDPSDASLFRLAVEPSEENGLRSASRLMVDKISTVERSKLGMRIGRLAQEDIVRLNRAVVVFLGISSRS
jgi:mRNA interferase MazF